MEKDNIDELPKIVNIDGSRVQIDTVTKFFTSNDVLDGHFNLEVTELKIILLLISAIGQDDDYCKLFTFSFTKFSELLDINISNFTKTIDPIINSFHEKIILIKSEKEQTHTRYNWMIKSEIDYKNHTISIGLNPYIHRFFINLKDGKYTGCNYLYASRLTSKYSIRFYTMIAKHYKLYNKKEKRHSFYKSIEELRKMLLLENKYPLTTMFRRNVLNVAQAELNELFKKGLIDYAFDYKAVKRGKTITGYKFYPTQQNLSPNKLIELNKNKSKNALEIDKHEFYRLRGMFDTMNKKQALEIISKLDMKEKEKILHELKKIEKIEKIDFLENDIIRYVQKKYDIEINHIAFEKWAGMMGYELYYTDNTNCAKRENSNE